MTVTPPVWCNDEPRRSTLWSATVNAQTFHLYKMEFTALQDTQWWDANATVEAAHARLPRDEGFTLEITRIGVSDGEFLVVPEDVAKHLDIVQVGNVLTIEVPAWVNYLGFVDTAVDPGTLLMLQFEDPHPARGIGDIDFDEGNPVSGVTAGQVLRFTAGFVYHIGDTAGTEPSWFTVENEATIVVEPGAVVIGNFDLRQAGAAAQRDIVFRGGGIISGEYKLPSDLSGFDYAVQKRYSVFYGEDGADAGWHNCVVQNLTFVSPVFDCNNGAINSFTDCMWLNWYWGIFGFGPIRDGEDDQRSSTTRCFAFNNDDTFRHTQGYAGILTRTQCYAITANGQGFTTYDFPMGQFSWAAGWETQEIDNGVLPYGLEDPLGIGAPFDRFHAGIRVIFSGTADMDSASMLPHTFINFHIDGTPNCAILQLETMVDPFIGGAARGCISNMRFIGLHVARMPVADRPLVKITALDERNYPSGLVIRDFTIGGVPVTTEKLLSMAQIDAKATNITLDGKVIA